MKKKTLNVLVMILVCMVMPMYLFAQPDPCDAGPCPIDGGLSLLLAAGLGYGVKKYKEQKKKHLEEKI